MNRFTSFPLFILILSSFGTQAAEAGISDFYQVWKLSKAVSGGCPAVLTAYADKDIAGVYGVPRKPIESNSIRFIQGDEVATEILTLGTNQSVLDEDVTTTVTLANATLTVVDKEMSGMFRRKETTTRTDVYTLLPQGGLSFSHQSRSEAPVQCTYENAYPEQFGKTALGAVLFHKGVKVAECTFLAAQSGAHELGFYNEKCSFGKFTIKQIIDDAHRVLSSELSSKEGASDMQLVRATDILNSETETWFSRDTEIAVIKSQVDDILPSNSEYFINPYRTTEYAIEGTHAVIKFQYGLTR